MYTFKDEILHKTANQIANDYDICCIEDISIKELAKKRKYKRYHRSLLDNGWYMFTTMLDYKLTDRGKLLIKTPKNYPSSRICSDCGYINNDINNDRIRKWICPKCGKSHDRDVNAAINIKNMGLQLCM